MAREPFRPTALMPRPIKASRTSYGVLVWYEGDDIMNHYEPGDVGFDKWAALADAQTKERKNEAA